MILKDLFERKNQVNFNRTKNTKNKYIFWFNNKVLHKVCVCLSFSNTSLDQPSFKTWDLEPQVFHSTGNYVCTFSKMCIFRAATLLPNMLRAATLLLDKGEGGFMPIFIKILIKPNIFFWFSLIFKNLSWIFPSVYQNFHWKSKKICSIYILFGFASRWFYFELPYHSKLNFLKKLRQSTTHKK